MPTITSWFKFTENKRFVRLKLKISRKGIWYFGQNNLHAFVRHWASPSNVFSHLLQNLLLKCLHFLPNTVLNLIISESSYSWSALSVFGIPLYSWEGGNGHLLPPGNWVEEPKISRTPKVSSLTNLILAMTVSFAGRTLTLHKSRIHCSGIMQWWVMSLQFAKFTTLPAEAIAKFGGG